MARIHELLAAGQCFSMELWPPRNEAAEARLETALSELRPLRPSFVSITYGAGGSTRERTHDLVVRMQRDYDLPTMAHLTCAAHGREELEAVLARYAEAGVENVLALRGDPPLGASGPLPPGELPHAIDLVELVRSVGDFSVAVAAHPQLHPEAADIEADRRHLAAKLRLADFAITQFFFRIEDYLALVDWLDAHGIDKPVVPGVMPITNVRTVTRMAQLSGCEVPAPIRARIEAVADRPAEVRKIGVEIATELCQKLLAEGVPGLHVYTMNQSAATRELYHHLGLAGHA
jgi:methylenetetrahydrofolate reductase (NADPH)